MWYGVLGLIFFGVCFFFCLFAALRIFILKSSREAPVFPIMHPAGAGTGGRGGAMEPCAWLRDLTELLWRVYVDALPADAARAVAQQRLNDAVGRERRVVVQQLDLGDALPQLHRAQASDDEDAQRLTLVADIGYARQQQQRDFSARLLVEWPLHIPGVGLASVPLDVSVSDVQLSARVRVEWDYAAHMRHGPDGRGVFRTSVELSPDGRACDARVAAQLGDRRKQQIAAQHLAGALKAAAAAAARSLAPGPGGGGVAWSAPLPAAPAAGPAAA